MTPKNEEAKKILAKKIAKKKAAKNASAKKTKASPAKATSKKTALKAAPKKAVLKKKTPVKPPKPDNMTMNSRNIVGKLTLLNGIVKKRVAKREDRLMLCAEIEDLKDFVRKTLLGIEPK
jgi:colicin import membrane protein